MSKRNYKLNEIASITGVKPYVLRFWMNEFFLEATAETEDGEKLYSEGTIEQVERIKTYLFDDKMSIEEAKAAVREAPAVVEVSQDEASFEPAVPELLPQIPPQDESLSNGDKVLLVRQKLEEIVSKSEVWLD